MPKITINTDGTPVGTSVEIDGKNLFADESTVVKLANFRWSSTDDQQNVIFEYTAHEKQSNGLIKRVSYTIDPKLGAKESSEVTHIPDELFKNKNDEMSFKILGKVPPYLQTD